MPTMRRCDRGPQDVGIKVNSRKVLGAVLKNAGVPVARALRVEVVVVFGEEMVVF